jgi:thiamine biosynthesis protein ThiS
MTGNAVITVTLNGEPRELAAGMTVADLLQHLGAPTIGVAVERNRQVVRRADHASTQVESGDIIEIVQFVGGG